jgi:hypothetical protein
LSDFSAAINSKRKRSHFSMADPTEDELLRQAEEIEEEIGKGKAQEAESKAQELARAVLSHLEKQREDPVAQRAALVRLAKVKYISRLLKESGLIEIRRDEKLGRIVIALRADDELVDRMHRANTAQILHSPDAPLIRVFRSAAS